MTKNQDKPLTVAAFQDLIDAFGANADRWPAGRRSCAEALLAESPAARVALAEALALDAVLDATPASSAPSSVDLVDRIVARAAALGEAAQQRTMAPTNVIPMPAKRSEYVSHTGAPMSPARSGVWRTATALAASLVTGLLVGSFDLAPVRNIAALANGDADAAEQLVAALHADGLSTAFDEDHQ